MTAKNQLERAKAMIERVMTEHWDISACSCTFCVEGRAIGFHPRNRYLHDPKTTGFLEVPKANSETDGKETHER